MLQNATLKFLKDLNKNNTKEWFDVNRSSYENAKTDFSAFVDNLIAKHGKKDEDIASLKAKDCIFRINRDVRFSKDKSPYKNNFGASINRGGKKSIFAGYYFHLQPGESFVGGGLWQPQPDDLKKVRQEIDYSLDEFKKIISSKKFKTVYGELYRGEDVALTRPPKGYEEDNPAIEFIKLKSFLAMRRITDAELTDKNLLKNIAEAFDALQPFINFLNRALKE
ncbi:DUF2461 domain-containing protein [Foetidibacter luteolus]|uniref:DUF2461 domain-containing protein n=1 Tax=Foetidibacter luteolus TaxID=2608880 RepID=UPI00129B0178|nr:DUF2461 domain-containing protein [Foetidibacter luteolus]